MARKVNRRATRARSNSDSARTAIAKTLMAAGEAAEQALRRQEQAHGNQQILPDVTLIKVKGPEENLSFDGDKVIDTDSGAVVAERSTRSSWTVTIEAFDAALSERDERYKAEIEQLKASFAEERAQFERDIERAITISADAARVDDFIAFHRHLQTINPRAATSGMCSLVPASQAFAVVRALTKKAEA